MTDNNYEDFLSQTLDYWNKISEVEQKELIANVKPVKYSAGESIHNTVNNCAGMFLVVSGELRTYILSDTGKEFTLFRLQKGGVCILSASCIFENITFDVFIDAETDCELLLINSQVLSRLHKQNPLIENHSLKLAIDRFSAVVKAMERMLFLTLERRLSVFLLGEAKKNKSADITLTHEQIAKYIGSAREVVSRTIKGFEKEGIVKLFRGGVRITDFNKLEALADGAEDNK